MAQELTCSYEIKSAFGPMIFGSGYENAKCLLSLDPSSQTASYICMSYNESHNNGFISNAKGRYSTVESPFTMDMLDYTGNIMYRTIHNENNGDFVTLAFHAPAIQKDRIIDDTLSDLAHEIKNAPPVGYAFGKYWC